MQVDYHRKFVKNYRKRIAYSPKIEKRFEERLVLFIKNPRDPLLRDHSLVGDKASYRAFSIGGDIRVVYKIIGDVLRLYDIGTHNQVY